MTPKQLMKHYNDNHIEASYMVGISLVTLRNWIKKGLIPIPQQTLIEQLTGGALKADIPKKMIERNRVANGR